MRVHAPFKIEQLKNLRKKGYSINDLMKELSLPKTTVWHHVHSIRLSPRQQAILRSRQGGSTIRKEMRIRDAEQKAREILRSKDRELGVILAMLHWAEGSKKSCEFINSDGRMITLYLLILKKLFNIDSEGITPTLRIFTGMNKKICLRYWARLTHIPPKRFFVRLNDGGLRGRTVYGMCRITVRKGNVILKIIQALINEVFDEVVSYR